MCFSRETFSTGCNFDIRKSYFSLFLFLIFKKIHELQQTDFFGRQTIYFSFDKKFRDQIPSDDLVRI